MIKRIMSPPSIDWVSKLQQKQDRVTDETLRSYYDAPIPTADTPVKDVMFLAMDFETTGLDSDADDIITIGTVPFDLNRIYLNKAQHWTVRPRKQLEEESVVIHGITHSDVLDAPDLVKIYGDVLEQMSGKIMVVHYQRIEREFFDKALMQRVQEGIEFPVVDTMQLESGIQSKLTGGIINKIRGRKPESVRLGKSRIRYGLPPYTPHHALTDAIATAELLQAQISHHYAPETPIGQLWI